MSRLHPWSRHPSDLFRVILQVWQRRSKGVFHHEGKRSRPQCKFQGLAYFQVWRTFRAGRRCAGLSQGPLLFCREAVSAGDDDARDYRIQLEALRRYDNPLELHGAFIALRNQAADRSRAYRGYLLNGKREPAKLVDIRDWLSVPTPQVRKILKCLEAVGLIERVELPEFDLSKNDKPGRTASPENSGESRKNPKPLKKGKESKGKETANGNGVREKKKNNGPKKEEKARQGQDQAPKPAQSAANCSSTPTATPPLLPTEADAQEAGRSTVTEGLLGSDMGAHLAALERRLRGLDPQPPPEMSPYSDRANLFASEIYLALGLNYGRTMEARERGCLAARWSEVERASLPPPVADSLWDEAIQAARKLRKRRTVKKPGAMFCRIWTALLTKAKTGVLTWEPRIRPRRCKTEMSEAIQLKSYCVLFGEAGAIYPRRRSQMPLSKALTVAGSFPRVCIFAVARSRVSSTWKTFFSI